MTSSIVVGEGRLSWPRMERVSDRYGTVILMADGDSLSPVSSYGRVDHSLIGQHGLLAVEVLETRESTHIGDMFRGLGPSTPNVGDRIELGSGTVFVELVEPGCEAIGLRPDDGRDSDWLDPEALYRAHEQTVRLVFVPTLH